MAKELAKPEEQTGLNIGSVSEVLKVAANLTMMKEFQATVMEHITSPFNIPTPKEKIKRRPDGYDYIENTWMDKEFKEHSPLYDNELVHYSEAAGWITMIVRVKDRATGNTELGAASVRIQVKQGVMEPTFRDIIDKGNNVAACLSKAIKNAQSRFGHGADVYGKRESTKTDEERNRFDSMLKEVKDISKVRAQQFEQGWNEIGVDFTDYLDKWQSFIEKNQNKKAVTEKDNVQISSDVSVITAQSQVESNANAEKNKQFVF